MSTNSIEFGSRVADFLTRLTIDVPLPEGIEVLQPYSDPEVCRVVHAMCTKYYSGHKPRVGVWGINPGRFGAGVTGLSFTDPFAVQNLLGIESSIAGRREISAEFIQQVIEAYGGPNSFYADFYLSALSPLGFVADGKNVNFYDTPELQSALTPMIQKWVSSQHQFGLRSDTTIILGTGKLQSFVERNVRTQCSFGNVIYLEHPRYIMQYRRKQRDAYVEKYINALRSTQQ